MNNLGINAHIPTYTQCLDIKDLNCSFVRLGFSWDIIEPVKGNFMFGPFDSAVNNLSGRNLYGSLAYTPKWANGGKGKCYSPDNTIDWEIFVAKCINRYKDKIHYWSIWNEPNLKDFWNESINNFIDKIFKPASITIRSLSDCFITGCDFSTHKDWNSWFDKFTKLQSYYDIFSYHVYGDDADDVIKKIEDGSWGKLFISDKRPIRKMLDKISKPKWLTEVGWEAGNDKQNGHQSNCYKNLIEKLKNKSYAEKILFYELQDSGDKFRYGIINSDKSKKPAFNTMKSYCV